MQRRMTTLAAIVSATALLAACGTDAETTDTTTPAETSADATTDETTDASTDESTSDEATGQWPDLSGQTLTVASDWSGAEQENFEAVLAEFENTTGASVNYQSLGNNVSTALGTMIEGGGAPNIALVPQPGLVSRNVSNK